MAFAHYTPLHKNYLVLFPIRSTTWCVITNSISNALRRAADAVGNDALRCAATPWWPLASHALTQRRIDQSCIA
jgi:hypothetical protein